MEGMKSTSTDLRREGAARVEERESSQGRAGVERRRGSQSFRDSKW